MSWYKELGLLEISFIGLFLLFYGAYIYRIVSAARKLNTGYGKIAPKLILRTIYFGLLIAALLGPSFGNAKKEVKSVGKDIMIAVDLSESMNAYDIAPTRLEKLKFELKNICDAFSSDRIGLVIFSSEAFVQCPLTYDQGALNLFIETLHTGLVPRRGTDFGPALETSYKKLTEDENKSDQQKSKIIILISDGEDFGDNTQSVAEKISDEGIKLFTLGIGTEKGSKIRVRRGFKKDNSGNEVITKLDSRSLKQLASETDGQYFEINYTENEVSRLISTINSIEGELKDTKFVDVSANKYYYFLGAALILLLIDMLFSVRVLRI